MTAKDPIARYMPDHGLVLEKTIKEEVQGLVDSGYFDKAENAIIAVSDRAQYDVRWAGQQFECWGLLGAAREKLSK